MADSFLTEEEEEHLKNGIKNLAKMSDSFFEDDGIPDVKDMRVVKELIEATSNQITRMGELRLRQESNEANEGLAEKAAELIKQLSKQKSNAMPSLLENRQREIPDRDLETLELVEGELEIAPGPLAKEDFLRSDDV
jgi:hypothetical protein